MGLLARTAMTFVAAWLATAPAAAQAQAAPADAQFGLYARLVGVWRSQISNGRAGVIIYSWDERGKVLKGKHRIDGAELLTEETITAGARPGTLDISTTVGDRTDVSTVTLNPDGSATEQYTGADGLGRRAVYRLEGPDRFTAMIERQAADGTWRPSWSSQMVRVSGIKG